MREWSCRMAMAALLLCMLRPAHAQISDSDVQSLKDRLHAAAADSSLDAKGLKPWYLKLDVRLPDAKGKLTQQGTIEEWWAAPRLYKVQYDVPGYLAVEVVNSDGYFRSKDAGPVPDMLQRLLRQVVHPMPGNGVVDEGTATTMKKAFDKQTLDCIMPGPVLKNFAHPPMGLYPTYCFDPGKHALRIAYSYGTESAVRNPTGHFQGRSVAVDVAMLEIHAQVATSHVVELRGMRVLADDYVPPPGLTARSEVPAEVSSAVAQSMRVSFVEPVYPDEAMGRHSEDSVMIRVKIGSDGHVYQPRLVAFNDPDLAIAALSAVRSWTYKPYMLDGAATDFETTITVTFTFAP